MFNNPSNAYESYSQLNRYSSQIQTRRHVILATSYGTMAIDLTDDAIIGRRDTDTSHFVFDLTRFNAIQMGVSRQHVYIMRDASGKVFIGDMQSSNGTILNGEQLIPHRLYALNHGDILKLGKLTICVRFG